MAEKTNPTKVLKEGADEITRSLGSLVDSSFHLVETGAEVIERELAMVIRLSERVRDQVISAELLEQARKQPTPAKFRADAHAAVDLAADLGAVAFLSTVNFIDGLTGRSPAPAKAEPVPVAG
jgi:hypothetical protein